MKEASLIQSEQDGFWTNYYLNKSSLKEQKVVKALLAELLSEKEVQGLISKIKNLDRESICCP